MTDWRHGMHTPDVVAGYTEKILAALFSEHRNGLWRGVEIVCKPLGGRIGQSCLLDVRAVRVAFGDKLARFWIRR
jgi:hypothetical protein